MTVYTYKQLVKQAKTCKTNVTSKYKLDMTAKWSYYFAKAILNPKKDIKKISFGNNPNPTQDKISVTATKSEYIQLCKDLVNFVEGPKKRLPNYVTFKGKKVAPRLLTYDFAKILVKYDANGKLQSEVKIVSSVFTKPADKTSTKCTNPYTSSPHYTSQGVGALGQATPYYCGPNSVHQCLKKFGITDFSQAKLASIAGTTTSGTDHAGINTAIAWVAKKKDIKLNVEWKNFSDFGKNNTARFEAIGKIACKPNKSVFFHIGYEDSGSARGSRVFGHYEACDKFNVKTKYVRALNSLGSRSGNGYLGHLQDRPFDLQAHYISNISQKSVCIITKG